MDMPSGMPRRRSGLTPKWSKQRCSRMQLLFDGRRMTSSRTQPLRRQRRGTSTCSRSPCCQAAALWWQQGASMM
eukprot:4558093-Amphidinium_carterae.1